MVVPDRKKYIYEIKVLKFLIKWKKFLTLKKIKMFLKNLILYFGLAFLVLNLIKKINGQTVNNIVFDLADLTVDYETDDGMIHLEAFKSSLNDLIIEKKSKRNMAS